MAVQLYLSVADEKVAAKGLIYSIGGLLYFNIITVWDISFAARLFIDISQLFPSLYFLILLMNQV
ncbi:MAG: hypothetical protein B6D64_13005 [Bacteroidetes bacterium 4484_276]|nr:MAG: hypothetical protein B6D64_13005 [Bacteroidetes bacterium 4484_276]